MNLTKENQQMVIEIIMATDVICVSKWMNNGIRLIGVYLFVS